MAERMTEKHRLLERRLAGEDVATGPVTVSEEPIEPHPDGEVRVARSVRMPLAAYHQIVALAQAQGSDYSKLVRRWILEGLARDTGEPLDAVSLSELISDLSAQLVATLRS